MQIVCFDTETTGLEVQKDHIIQLSLVKVDTETWEQIDTRDWYLLPEVPFTISAEAEAVHHISKQFLLENGVTLRSVYDDLIAFTAGCDMLSYNGNGFDALILHFNLQRIGKDFDFERTWYDALLLERKHVAETYPQPEEVTDENRISCNLTAAYTRYYGHPFEGAHNSLDDVLATIEVFKAQIQNHGWAWAQQEDFQFISFDRWLVRRGQYYYLNMGAHKGESIETMLRIDKSYLEWIAGSCKWTDQQTRDIILSYLGTPAPKVSAPEPESAPSAGEGPKSSDGKKKSKGVITDADLKLFE